MMAVRNGSLQEKTVPVRNYGLDIIKLFLTAMVFLSHTLDFRPETVTLPLFIRKDNLGWYSVHFFFVISGFLMTNSFFRRYAGNGSADSGKRTAEFVSGRFKGIAPMYYTAFFMSVVFYFIEDSGRLGAGNFINALYRLVPEALMLNMAGFDKALYLNLPTWYIQAMLLCMLPVFYLLQRNRDMFLRIIAPLGALGAAVFLYSTPRGTDCILTSQLIRGFWGILSGCLGYVIYQRLKKLETTKTMTVLLTAAEWMIYVFSFAGCYTSIVSEENNILAAIPFPAAAAITFSGKSLSAKIFSSPKLKFISGLSTVVYFNHWLARRIVLTYFPEAGWRRASLYMVLITVLTCLICYGLQKLCRLVWNGYLKEKILVKE